MDVCLDVVFCMFVWLSKVVTKVVNGAAFGPEWSAIRISTDSRTINQGKLFFALRGPNFDGHKFLCDAFKKGAVAAIVDNIPDGFDKEKFPLIVVDDVYHALGAMASYLRQNIKAKVIGVTGSYGKTTTVSMIASLLKQYGSVHVPEKNFNNRIGVPITILKCSTTVDYLVVELGISCIGEMAVIGSIVCPDIAVITAIGTAHILGFGGSKDNIIKEKLSIVSYMKKDGVVIIPKYDEEVFKSIQDFIHNNDCGKYLKVITCGIENGADVFCEYVSTDFARVVVKNKKFVYSIPVYSEHFYHNSFFAIAVLHAMNLNMEESLHKGFQNFIPGNGRGRIIKYNFNKKYVTVIDDSYNASYETMVNALKVLSNFSCSRKVAVLGSMVELGEWSETLHASLLPYFMYIDKVIVVGKDITNNAYNLLKDSQKLAACDNAEDAGSILYENISDGDCILLKSSRIFALDKVIKYFNKKATII